MSCSTHDPYNSLGVKGKCTYSVCSFLALRRYILRADLSGEPVPPLLASFWISTAVKEEQQWSLRSKENKKDKIEDRVHHVPR